MSWINNLAERGRSRGTPFNNSVILDRTGVLEMCNQFNQVFGDITSFKSEVASLTMFPIRPPIKKTGTLGSVRAVYNTIQAQEIDYSKYYCSLGQFQVQHKFYNFADYKGYTYIKVYLPFLGYVDVDVNECMGKFLQFRMVVDYYTGKAVYLIGVTDVQLNFKNDDYPTQEEDSTLRIISTFEFNLGVEIPIGSTNLGDIKRNLAIGTVKAGVGLITAVSTGMLPPATNTVEETTTYDIQGRSTRKGSRMKQIKSGTETVEKTTTYNRPVNKAQPFAEAFENSLDALNKVYPTNSCDRVNDSYLLWYMTGRVHIIIYRPNIVNVDKDYLKLFGKPLGAVKKLSELSGYTEISAIRIEGEGFENITQKEVAYIEQLLSNGIII